jgi:aminoglycoside phosphotransferase (APT) family kinase protein
VARSRLAALGGSIPIVANLTPRLLDWRYVLPLDAPKLGRVVLIGAPSAVALALEQDGLADEVLREWCPPGSADVAVVFRGSRQAIDPVAAMLRPGGSLYWDVSRVRPWRVHLTPTTARAMLIKAGLQPVEVYWVTSGPAGPSMHLPLGVDGAVAWYFSTHRGSSDPLRRLVGHLLQILSAGRGRRLGRLIPTFAVTARRPSSNESEPAESATALTAASVPGWPTGADVRPIMLAGGDGPWSRTVLLPFASDSREPSGVIKIARSSAYAPNILAEQEVLGRLGSTLPADLRASLPEPLGGARVLGQAASVESYRRGRSIRARSTGPGASRATQRADLERAAGWLRAFHDATATPPASLDSGALDIARLGDRFARAFGREEPEERMFRRLDAGVRDSLDPILPVVIEHRDFGPWNVLVDGDGTISVIDWEVAGEGPPLVDLVYFVAHWCWLVAGADSTSAQIETLRSLVTGDMPAWSTTAGRAIIVHQARTFGLAPELVAGLVVWTFTEQALDRHDRLAAIGEPLARDRASNRYVQCVGALAALPDLVGRTGDMLDAEPKRAT